MTHLPIESVVCTNDLVSRQKWTDSVDNCDLFCDDNVIVDHVNNPLIFKGYSKETVD